MSPLEVVVAEVAAETILVQHQMNTSAAVAYQVMTDTVVGLEGLFIVVLQ